MKIILATASVNEGRSACCLGGGGTPPKPPQISAM